jgi:fructose-bisphosphate aldolase class I
MAYNEQLDKIINEDGFIAALDQSGGSTPKALLQYDVDHSYYKNDTEMYDQIHSMRERIGAILFEMTMNKEIIGKKTAKYLWEDLGIIPFLKIDSGLESEHNGVHLLKDIKDIDKKLENAVSNGIFGTKMRSVINSASLEGINDVVDQQFKLSHQINKHNLIPIIEPEVTISISDKENAEVILIQSILKNLEKMPKSNKVILKLSLPEIPNFYQPLMNHESVLRVVALSGGYDQTNAIKKLECNNGMIASFSRALTEGLSINQNDEEFNLIINKSINNIAKASKT